MYLSILFLIGCISTLAYSLSSHCLILQNMVITGGTYDEFPATEIMSCCVRCSKDPCCKAYTFDKIKERCYMKSAIGSSEVSSSFVSGLKANSHGGQGATLKNIKISGGSASDIQLPSASDCHQYCTAYGIFSWRPSERPEERNGDCSCMTKIGLIEYSFGARSAIFPNSELARKK